MGLGSCHVPPSSGTGSASPSEGISSHDGCSQGWRSPFREALRWKNTRVYPVPEQTYPSDPTFRRSSIFRSSRQARQSLRRGLRQTSSRSSVWSTDVFSDSLFFSPPFLEAKPRFVKLVWCLVTSMEGSVSRRKRGSNGGRWVRFLRTTMFDDSFLFFPSRFGWLFPLANILHTVYVYRASRWIIWQVDCESHRSRWIASNFGLLFHLYTLRYILFYKFWNFLSFYRYQLHFEDLNFFPRIQQINQTSLRLFASLESR